MNNSLPADLGVIATKAAMEIIRDLSGRSGIGNEWENIDVYTQTEIAIAWGEIILAALKKVTP